MILSIFFLAKHGRNLNILKLLSIFTQEDILKITSSFKVVAVISYRTNSVKLYSIQDRQCSSKESTCQCNRHRRCEFDPWVAKIPWRRKWQLQYSCQDNLMDRGAWGSSVACSHSSCGFQKLHMSQHMDTTEATQQKQQQQQQHIQGIMMAIKYQQLWYFQNVYFGVSGTITTLYVQQSHKQKLQK